jgi:hypothetical protein
MGKAFDHILQELDQISLQEQYALRDLLDERLATANGVEVPIHTSNEAESTDPLAGLRVATGIEDLAEHFDDYRFGRLTR